MALPTYTTTGQKIGYYGVLAYCAMVFFFLIAPIFIIIPLCFNQSPFFGFTKFINLLYLFIWACSKVSSEELKIPHEYVRDLSSQVEKKSFPRS